MKLLRLTGLLPFAAGKAADSRRAARGEYREQRAAIGAEKASLVQERKKREGELTSQRNRLALSMARARRNRGGFGFGAVAQPSQGNVRATLG